MTYRVLRILEYRYEDADRMIADQAAWSVQGTERFGTVTIRSTTLPADILDDHPERRASRACCTVHLAAVVAGARGQIEILTVPQSALGGGLCPLCLEKFVDNQVTRIVRAERFEEEGS